MAKNDSTETWSYTYDKRNQLLQIEKNQETIGQYSYDGEGRRIKKTEWVESLQDYQTIIYIYSGHDVVYEKNMAAGQEATYVYGPCGRLAKKVNGLTDYYHTDHLGSTRVTTNEQGNTVTEAVYTPYGENVVEGEENYLFTGKERDSSGLHYYGAHYYDSSLGRFITKDTWLGEIRDPQTPNGYTYCKNNPMKYIDKWGNFAVKTRARHQVHDIEFPFADR